MPDIQIENLTKQFGGDVTALNDVTFQVEDREFVFLLGPSGAGKTTSLRLVAGLEKPTSGRILLSGQDVAGKAPRDRNVAMVYDKHSLYPHLSVFENMAYPLRLRGQTDAQMRTKISATAEILGIEQLLERRPTELSGGQQQRVAIGRALVRDANAYLMDEPISHLDAKLRAHMRVEFKKLQQEFDATILYVSHDQLEAMTMGDRIVVLNDGVVQQIGAPRDIFDRPANQFVAEFVGEPSMNTLPCTLVQADDHWIVRSGSFSVQVSKDWVTKYRLADRDSNAFVLGVRPNRIEVVGPETANVPNVETGSVYAVETLGSETVFDVEIENEIIRVWSRNATKSAGSFQINDPIHFQVDPDTLFLFDRKTGATVAYPAT